MCTLTFIARRHGFALGMNRDEKLARPAALPAAQHPLDGRDALFPSEPNGGTWIGINDVGAAFALLNCYAAPMRVAGQTLSRGAVVRSALAADSPDLVGKVLAKLPLVHLNPFRLIGVFPASCGLFEWRWNLQELERLDHRWRTSAWFSSGFDEPGAQHAREEGFRETLRQSSFGSLDCLRRLHRSHKLGRGHYSHCVHRADAATVSYTEIVVVHRIATLHYTPGAPCQATPLPAVRLQLNQ